MNDIQKQAQEAIGRLVESGVERGLQVAVYRHGEPVVDAVAGVADPKTGRPVRPDTLFYSYSVGLFVFFDPPSEPGTPQEPRPHPRCRP